MSKARQTKKAAEKEAGAVFGKYWMVHGAVDSAPTGFHSSRASAIAEAERLAKEHPDELFVVLQAVDGRMARVVVEPVRAAVTDCNLFVATRDDESPF